MSDVECCSSVVEVVEFDQTKTLGPPRQPGKTLIKLTTKPLMNDEINFRKRHTGPK